MPARSRSIVTACCLALAMPLAAQDTTSREPALAQETDSVAWSAGKADGRESAEHAVVLHRGLIGFVAGIPIGFFVIPAAYTLDPRVLTVTGVGVAGIVGAGKLGNTDPPAEAVEHALRRGPAYERGLREGYREQLRSRRMKAATGGAAAGMGVGAGLLLYLIAHID